MSLTTERANAKKMPLLGIAEYLEKESKLDQAKYALEKVEKSPLATEDHKKEAKVKLKRVETKMREQNQETLSSYTVVVKKVEELTPHPTAEATIKLSHTAYNLIKNDIKTHGIHDCLLITENNEIICGMHRWKAAKELGILELPCRVVKFQDEDGIIKLAIRDNVIRRHLTKEETTSLLRKLELLNGKRKAGRPTKEEKKVPRIKEILKPEEKEVMETKPIEEKEIVEYKPKSKPEIVKVVDRYGLSIGKRFNIEKSFAQETSEAIWDKIDWFMENELSKGDRLDVEVVYVTTCYPKE